MLVAVLSLPHQQKKVHHKNIYNCNITHGKLGLQGKRSYQVQMQYYHLWLPTSIYLCRKFHADKHKELWCQNSTIMQCLPTTFYQDRWLMQFEEQCAWSTYPGQCRSNRSRRTYARSRTLGSLMCVSSSKESSNTERTAGMRFDDFSRSSKIATKFNSSESRPWMTFEIACLSTRT